MAAALQQAAADINRYPDFGSAELVAALADRFDVPEARVAVGTGSVGVAQQTNSLPYRLTVLRQINTQHRCTTLHDRQKAGASPQQTGLPRTIRALEKHNFARLDGD